MLAFGWGLGTGLATIVNGWYSVPSRLSATPHAHAYPQTINVPVQRHVSHTNRADAILILIIMISPTMALHKNQSLNFYYPARRIIVAIGKTTPTETSTIRTLHFDS